MREEFNADVAWEGISDVGISDVAWEVLHGRGFRCCMRGDSDVHCCMGGRGFRCGNSDVA